MCCDYFTFTYRPRSNIFTLTCKLPTDNFYTKSKIKYSLCDRSHLVEHHPLSHFQIFSASCQKVELFNFLVELGTISFVDNFFLLSNSLVIGFFATNSFSVFCSLHFGSFIFCLFSTSVKSNPRLISKSKYYFIWKNIFEIKYLIIR